MKKYITLTLLLMLVATPVTYASYVYFFPPDPTLRTVPYPALGSGPYRAAYKPYPAPRSQAAIRYYYNTESRRYIDAVRQEFRSSAQEVEQSIKAADNAAKDFDVLAGALY